MFSWHNKRGFTFYSAHCCIAENEIGFSKKPSNFWSLSEMNFFLSFSPYQRACTELCIHKLFGCYNILLVNLLVSEQGFIKHNYSLNQPSESVVMITPDLNKPTNIKCCHNKLKRRLVYLRVRESNFQEFIT